MQLMHINSLEIVSKPYNKSCIFFKDWDKGFLRSVYYGTLFNIIYQYALFKYIAIIVAKLKDCCNLNCICTSRY